MPETEKRIVDTTMTIAELRLSQLNVRTSEADTSDTSQLEALILADGLMYPMSVHQLRGSALWGAFAGGRRYRSIKKLIERGDVPADTQWKVRQYIGYSDAELIELSINENLPRRDLHAYEVYAGIRRAHGLGHDVPTIAAALNQNPDSIERFLRLGSLAKPIFAAFAGGTISEDQAKAFAGTADGKLQLAVFERLAPIGPVSPKPQEIRAALRIGDAQAQRELAFVGFDAYRDAGGRFELDLFAEQAEERGRVVDLGVLQKLVNAQLGEIRDAVRISTGRPSLRFVAEQPLTDYKIVDHQLAITPRRQDNGTLELPASDGVVAHIAIDASGAPVISYWWESRKVKFGSERKPLAAPAAPAPSIPPTPAAPEAESPFAARHRADAAQAENDGLSKDALFALRAVRKAILRAALIEDARAAGDVAQDYLIWAQIRLLLVEPRPAGFGMRAIGVEQSTGVSNEAFALARDQIAVTRAAQITGEAISEIKRQPFFAESDLLAAFLAYRVAEPHLKQLAAAVVAGIALERGIAGDLPIHDVVAHEARVDRDAALRRLWQPTADFLGLFPKDQRAKFAEPFVDHAATTAAWSKQKSSDLTGNVLAVLTRGGKGGSWVHPMLRFTSPYLAHQADAREAAQ